VSGALVLLGHPWPGSRTAALGTAVGRALAPAAGGGASVVDLAPLGHRVLLADDPDAAAARDAVVGASLLVAVTPTWKGSYTGLLKAFVDGLGRDPLAGRVAVPVTTGGTAAAAQVTEGRLRALLVDLGALVVPGLAVGEGSLDDPGGAVAAYAAAHGTWLAERLGVPA
jgi:FMN reductase